MNMDAPMHEAMALLFERGKANMTTSELEALASLSDLATDEARRLAKVCGGLGCLVGADGASPSGVGTFSDPRDVSSLLFSLAHSFDTIAGMTHIGDAARVAMQGVKP